MEVLFFGQVTDITNTSSLLVDTCEDLDVLKYLLFNQFPNLADAKLLIAVDNKIVHENISLNENSKISFMSPYSGG
jgi:molybdopterin converting factor small subunit